MQEYLERHQILFFFILPVMMFAGMATSTAGIVIAAAGVMYLTYEGKHDSIILLFFFVLLLGDSRAIFFQFIKSLRVEILIMMFAISVYELKNRYYRVSAIMLYFIPFLSVAMLALIFSPVIQMGVEKTMSFTLFYFVAFNYIHNKFEVYGSQLMIDCFYLIIVILAVGLLLMPVFPEFVSYGGLRFNGIMGNPNGMGMLVTLSCPVAFYLFKRERTFSRGFKTLSWLLLIGSLLLCSSRNAILSVALFFLVAWGLKGGVVRRIGFLFIFLPGMAMLYYYIDLETVVYGLGLEKYFRVKEFDTGSGRIFAWQHAYELIKKSPLIGCGFACEEYNFIFKANFQLWHTGHQGGVHNSYLAYAINTGIIGLTFFIGFLLNAARKVRDFKFLIPFLISAFFSALFESWLFSSLSAFHIVFLLFLVYLIVDTNKEELLVSNLAGDLSNAAAIGTVT